MSEDFKNEESNVPPEKRVEITTEKTEQKNVDGFKELRTSDKLLKSVEEHFDNKPPILSISILDFVNLNGLSNERVKKFLTKESAHSDFAKHWFNSTRSAIKKSILKNDYTPVSQKIIELKAKK